MKLTREQIEDIFMCAKSVHPVGDKGVSVEIDFKKFEELGYKIVEEKTCSNCKHENEGNWGDPECYTIVGDCIDYDKWELKE